MRKIDGKTAIYIILFLTFLSLHIQYPVFTPYAIALGASTLVVGILLSSGSLANLIGNLLAGPVIDRIGKKPFIIVPLFLVGFGLLGHSFIHEPMSLLVLRIFNGFVLAFLTPACLALLSTYAKNSREQSEYMSINALIVTIANIIAPILGGVLVQKIGYEGTYVCIGVIFFITGFIALGTIQEQKHGYAKKMKGTLKEVIEKKELYPVFFTSFVLMFCQGVIMYELPFLSIESGLSVGQIGMLFSFIGVGTLAILCVFYLNRVQALVRAIVGMCLISCSLYILVIPSFFVGLEVLLLLFGVGIGLIFPAITTLLTERVHKEQYGRAFAICSAVFSVGSITSPLVAALVRSYISPYFIAFLVAMFAILILVFERLNHPRRPSAISPVSR